MLINPNQAINEGWIKFPSWMTEEQRIKCIQPNAIDITGDKFFLLNESDTQAHVSETSKSFHALKEIRPSTTSDTITLMAQRTYDVMSDFYVEIPEGVAAELIIRSTLNRLGLALNAGLWDSGFKGNLGCIIHNRMDTPILIDIHTRICQIKFYKSDSAGVYAGGYNTNQGQHWTTK